MIQNFRELPRWRLYPPLFNRVLPDGSKVRIIPARRSRTD